MLQLDARTQRKRNPSFSTHPKLRSVSVLPLVSFPVIHPLVLLFAVPLPSHVAFIGRQGKIDSVRIKRNIFLQVTSLLVEILQFDPLALDL